MDKSIEQLARDLARANYSERTQEEYVRTAQDLAKWCGGKPLVEVTRDELRGFVEMVVERGKSPSRMSAWLCAVLFLFRRTLGRPELVSFIKLPRRHSPLPEVLSLTEVKALLSRITHRRYQSIAMVMYGAGLRISEAIALEVRDIDGNRGVLRVRHGKGDKAREAKLSPTLYEWLRQYWAKERPPLPYLFASPKTGKLPAVGTVRKALALAAKEAWIKKRVTPHVLRHSFATHLLDEGTDVHVVGALLGHASIQTTARYARVTQKRVRETPSPLDLLPQRR
ncbi:MAG: site-specific integrase [Myxococcota bacterium]|nr:site-specific integrase [Myxococcota bacterium]